MIFDDIPRPVRRICQRPDGCVPAAAASAAASMRRISPHALEAILRARLGTDWARGARFEDAARILQWLSIPALPLRGEPLRDVLWRHDRGAVVLGVDPSVLYALPPGRHAIFVRRVQLPEARTRLPRALLGRLMLPVEIADPNCRAPARQQFPFEQLDRAYRAAGSQALLIPDA